MQLHNGSAEMYVRRTFLSRNAHCSYTFQAHNHDRCHSHCNTASLMPTAAEREYELCQQGCHTGSRNLPIPAPSNQQVLLQVGDPHLDSQSLPQLKYLSTLAGGGIRCVDRQRLHTLPERYPSCTCLDSPGPSVCSIQAQEYSQARFQFVPPPQLVY